MPAEVERALEITVTEIKNATMKSHFLFPQIR